MGEGRASPPKAGESKVALSPGCSNKDLSEQSTRPKGYLAACTSVRQKNTDNQAPGACNDFGGDGPRASTGQLHLKRNTARGKNASPHIHKCYIIFMILKFHTCCVQVPFVVLMSSRKDAGQFALIPLMPQDCWPHSVTLNEHLLCMPPACFLFFPHVGNSWPVPCVSEKVLRFQVSSND